MICCGDGQLVTSLVRLALDGGAGVNDRGKNHGNDRSEGVLVIDVTHGHCWVSLSVVVGIEDDLVGS